MQNNCQIGVIGAGSFGTALAILLADKGHEVALWGHNSGHLDKLKDDRENRKYLPGVSFPVSLTVEHELQTAVKGSTVLVMAIPSHCYRSVFRKCLPFIESHCRIVSAVKGIENDSMMTMTQVMTELVEKSGNVQKGIELGVLSGPSFAREVADKIPTAVTVAFEDLQTTKDMQQLFVTEYFRVYGSTDLIGLEISGSLKNIIAIAAGVCDGLGYGLNTRAALITRGLAEIQRLGMKLNGEAATFSGLSGLGDLLLTCTGDLSRNRTVGLKLGQGKDLEQITAEMKMVAEGVKTTKSAYDLARKMQIEMPILEQVYNIIYQGKNCAEAVRDLLNRELKIE